MNLNNQHSSINFSYQIFDKSIDFFDTTFYIKNRRLHTTMFTKPMDKQNYLHYKSEHPLPLENNIPFGQILRIKRICSEALGFLRNCTKINSRFTQRGYPESITQEAYYKTTSMQRKSLLQIKAVTSCGTHKRNQQETDDQTFKIRQSRLIKFNKSK